MRAYGDPVDPTSGKVNMKTFSQIIHSVRDQMTKRDTIDAFIFTDLVEQEVSFSGGLKHYARWAGCVTRTPTMQGPGDGRQYGIRLEYVGRRRLATGHSLRCKS